MEGQVEDEKKLDKLGWFTIYTHTALNLESMPQCKCMVHTTVWYNAHNWKYAAVAFLVPWGWWSFLVQTCGGAVVRSLVHIFLASLSGQFETSAESVHARYSPRNLPHCIAS